jgi:photosystem II PsbY protein
VSPLASASRLPPSSACPSRLTPPPSSCRPLGLDARIIIFGAFVPVLGWVAYNILGPGLNQLEDMQKAAAKKKGVAAGLGLSAAALLGMPEQADAATELMQTAGLDARIIIFGAFVPVLGWVAYNILGPGLNQLEDMQKAAAKKKGVAAGLGLSAAALLGMPEQADAATELMQTAGLDARIIIFGAFVPVLGWVAYNILGPGLNQLEDMQKAAAKKK